MTIPKWSQLCWPILRFAEIQGEIRPAQTEKEMADCFNLTEEEREELIPSGTWTKISDRTSWAISSLFRRGLLDRPSRGVYRLSNKGHQALRDFPNGLDGKEVERRWKAANTLQANTATTSPTAEEVENSTPEEAIRIGVSTLESALQIDLLERVRLQTPAFFERLVVTLLLRMGFGGGSPEAGRAIGGAGDGGIDGVIDQDALGLDRVYIQAKRYSSDNTVGPMAIQAFFGALNMAKASKGVFITTSSFTKSAAETAEKLGSRIVLIDGIRLAALMIRYDVGARVEQTFHIKKIDEDFFGEGE